VCGRGEIGLQQSRRHDRIWSVATGAHKEELDDSIMLKPMTRTPPATEIVFKDVFKTRSETNLPSVFEESTKTVAVDEEVTESEWSKVNECQSGTLPIRNGLRFTVVSFNTCVSFSLSTSFLFLILGPDVKAENGESMEVIESRAGMDIVASHAAMSNSAAAMTRTNVRLAIFNDCLQRTVNGLIFCELSKVTEIQ
jgi:hypothetical protein